MQKLKKNIAFITVGLLLAGCSALPVNTPEKVISGKNVTVNINVDELSPEDIESIQLNGKTLDKTAYNLKEQKLILPEMAEGKHVINLSHKTLGNIEIPVEVQEQINNYFQFNPSIVDGRINEWETGVDSDQDGNIDADKFFSRKYESYVVVRDFNGKVNYLNKDNVKEDFRSGKQRPKPDGLQFPELKENEFRPGGPPEKDTEGVYPFNGNVIITLPDGLNISKVKALISGEFLFPESRFIVKEKNLIIDAATLKGKSNIKMYLIDETGSGVLLAIDAKMPLVPDSGQIQPSPEDRKPPSPGEMSRQQPPQGGHLQPPPPQGERKPGETRLQQEGKNNFSLKNVPEAKHGNKPASLFDEANIIRIDSSALTFTIKRNETITIDELNRLANMQKETLDTNKPPFNESPDFIRLPVKNEKGEEQGYVIISPEGEIENYQAD